MAELSTMALHERADQAAGSGDFLGALKNAGEALRAAPLDPKARVKVAICLSMLGRGQAAAEGLRVTAIALGRRGYMLSAIGACRDALGLAPGAEPIKEVLKSIHARIHGKVGRGRARVPPPAPPTKIDPEAEGSLFSMAEQDAVLDAAEKMVTTDPTAGEDDADPGFVPFFSDVSCEAFVELVEKMAYLKVGPNHPVVKEDDPGTSLFLLVAGEVSVAKGSGDAAAELARLGSGSLFGEMSLITAKPRTATVTTTKPAELFEIDRKLVDEVAKAHPAVSEEIVKFAKKRLLMNVMATSKIFQPFSDQQRFALLREFTSRVFKEGVPVIQEDSEGQGLYVVLEGEVEVSKADDAGDSVVLAYLKEGDVFGEVSLVEDRKTIARVVPTEKTVVLELAKDKFHAVTKDHPKILEYLSTLSADRLEETEGAMDADGVILDADDLIIL